MADPGRGSWFAIVGKVPDDVRAPLSQLRDGRSIALEDLGEIPSSAFLRLEALLVGAGVDEASLAGWLPSLRTANPTMAVVALCPDGADAGSVANWVDEVAGTREQRAAFVGLLGERLRRRSPVYGAVRLLSRMRAQAIAIVALFALWGGFVAVFQPMPFILPSPAQVAHAFSAQSGRFMLHTLITAYEAMLGFCLGNGLGIALAIALFRYVRLRTFTLPVLISLQAIPIVAFAPLLGVWLGSGLASKVAMAAIICFFPMVVNALQAFSSVEKEFIELFRIYRAGFGTTLMRLLIPASAPSIIAALKISAGLSVVGAIVAEMTGANRGLGYLILTAGYRLETDIMFVAMLLSGLVGVVFFHMPETLRLLLPRSWIRAMSATTAT